MYENYKGYELDQKLLHVHKVRLNFKFSQVLSRK